MMISLWGKTEPDHKFPFQSICIIHGSVPLPCAFSYIFFNFTMSLCMIWCLCAFMLERPLALPNTLERRGKKGGGDKNLVHSKYTSCRLLAWIQVNFRTISPHLLLPSHLIRWDGILCVISIKQCHLVGPRKSALSVVASVFDSRYPKLTLTSITLWKSLKTGLFPQALGLKL